MIKKMIICALSLGLVLTASARERKMPIPKVVKEKLVRESKLMKEHEASLFIVPYKGYGKSFSRLFKGYKVYTVCRTLVEGKRESTFGTGYTLLSYKDTHKTFLGSSDLIVYLLKKYEGPLKTAKDIKKVFRAFGGVEEVVKVDGGYHIFTGEKFFKARSGYVLMMKKDGSIESCKHEFKLAE